MANLNQCDGCALGLTKSKHGIHMFDNGQPYMQCVKRKHTCEVCNGKGEVESDNNGSIYPCPLCNIDTNTLEEE